MTVNELIEQLKKMPRTFEVELLIYTSVNIVETADIDYICVKNDKVVIEAYNESP